MVNIELKTKILNIALDIINKENIPHYKDSIEYLLLREFRQRDGSMRKLHTVSVHAPISDQKYRGDDFYTVTIDPETLKVVFIVGPQFFKEYS